jgi:L-malate glycosyltransferase
MMSSDKNPASDVLIVAPAPPPYGGMAIQAKLLEKLLIDDGLAVAFFPTNLRFPRPLQIVSRIMFARTLLRTILIWIRLWKYVKNSSVVHVFAASRVYFFAIVAPAVLYARIHHKRLVLNYRGGDARRFFKIWGWLARPVLSHADVVTAPSGFLANAIEASFQIPVTIVRNILKTTVFRFRERGYVEPKLLVTRHLESIYDVETALHAFRSLQQLYPEASLTIAGTGSQERRLRELVTLGQLNNVRFLGHVPHEHLAAIYDECHILLNSSRVDNFPGSLLEASGAGLVIVSTNAGGIPFMYTNEESALLSDPGDWRAMATNVQRVLESPALGRKLVKQARLLARQCDWAEVRRSLYGVYAFEDGLAPTVGDVSSLCVPLRPE